MSNWITEFALLQSEKDMVTMNWADRDEIERIQMRIRGRSKLLKILRRSFRRKGLVNVSTDSANPKWIQRSNIL